jgi:hypothetical protein
MLKFDFIPKQLIVITVRWLAHSLYDCLLTHFTIACSLILTHCTIALLTHCMYDGLRTRCTVACSLIVRFLARHCTVSCLFIVRFLAHSLYGCFVHSLYGCLLTHCTMACSLNVQLLECQLFFYIYFICLSYFKE